MGSANGIGNGSSNFPFVGQGAYVDLGYGFDAPVELQSLRVLQLPEPKFATAYASSMKPWFFTARALSDVFGNQLAPGYTVFDTWSFHYENNGLNEIEDGDQRCRLATGTNGLDDVGNFRNRRGKRHRRLDASDYAVSAPTTSASGRRCRPMTSHSAACRCSCGSTNATAGRCGK